MDPYVIVAALALIIVLDLVAALFGADSRTDFADR